jgi:hypothetical protein
MAGVDFLKSHVEGLVSEGLTAAGVMDVMHEAEAADDWDVVEACKAFIRAHPTEVRPTDGPDGILARLW